MLYFVLFVVETANHIKDKAISLVWWTK